MYVRQQSTWHKRHTEHNGSVNRIANMLRRFHSGGTFWCGFAYGCLLVFVLSLSTRLTYDTRMTNLEISCSNRETETVRKSRLQSTELSRPPITHTEDGVISGFPDPLRVPDNSWHRGRSDDKV